VGSKHPQWTGYNIGQFFCSILEFGKDFNFFGDENKGLGGETIYFLHKRRGGKWTLQKKGHDVEYVEEKKSFNPSKLLVNRVFLQKEKIYKGLWIRDWKGMAKTVFSFVREQQIYIAKKKIKLGTLGEKIISIHIRAFGKYFLYSKMKLKFLEVGSRVFFRLQ